MLHSLIGVDKPAAWSLSRAESLVRLVSLEQMDRALDEAARCAQATVAEYIAAPLLSRRADRLLIELAVECFVPPSVADEFRRGFEHALQRRCPAYAAGRMDGRFEAAVVHLLPAGVFHQWRHVWRLSEQVLRDARWSAARDSIEGVLRQAACGWRELPAG